MFQKNQLLETEITDITNEGEGVGKVDGFTFFVKDAIIKDRALIRVTKVKKTYGYARLEKLLDPSPYRIEPICPVARQCGGCQIQAMDYKEQLKFKSSKVRNNLVRIGGFSEKLIDGIFEPIMGMETTLDGVSESIGCDGLKVYDMECKDMKCDGLKGHSCGFRYRNKAQFPFGKDKSGNTIYGFYAGRTHSIIPVEDCALGVSENKVILDIILDWMNRNGVEPYDETTCSGLIRHALIRKGFHTGEIMVCLVINGDSIPSSDSLTEELSKVSGMKSISLSVNKKNTNVIMGDNYRTIWGADTITDTLLGLKYSISPLSFYQVNPIQVEKLYETAVEYADIKPGDEVWDLCCGIGTITLTVAKKMANMAAGMATDAATDAVTGKVYGIEIVPQAIEDARNNAKVNGIDNVEFICGAVEEYLPKNAESIHADVVIMDPPRKGMDEEALRVVYEAAPSRIVYVSCDSATLARDLKYLCEHGYELKRVRACDMFPQTVHVETVCLLSKLHEAKHHVSVKLDMDEMDLTSAESKATYEEIKKYVAEHNDGMKVSNLYIAQVKRKCGLELAENFNLPKSEDSRQPQCPKEKEEAILEALKYFQMI